MLQDRIRLSHPWIKVKNQIDELRYRLAMAEDQEEAELFLFRLYFENETDLNFFDLDDRARIKGYLRFLMQDTRRHKEMIGEMIEEIRTVGEVADESRTT